MRKRVKWLIFGVLAFLVAAVAAAPVRADHSFGTPDPSFNPSTRNLVGTQLRDDLREVRRAGNYYIGYRAVRVSEGADQNDYASVSFSLNLCRQVVEACEPTIAGLMTTATNVRWFVYSHQFTVECVRGRDEFWRNEKDQPIGCIGDGGGIVKLGAWHRIQVSRMNSKYWRVYVYEADSTSRRHLVARVKSSSREISLAASNVMETGEKVGMQAAFFHRMPHYKRGGWKMWPKSASSSVDDHALNYAAVATQDCWDGTPDQYGILDMISPSGGEWYTGSMLNTTGRVEFQCHSQSLW
jgi:hypothetical protein